MFAAGFTFAVFPFGKPLSQLTVPVQPTIVSVTLLPAHIVGLFTVMTGFGLTVTVLTAVPLQPEAVVQVAV